ncbi:MAG: AraC family transcriptional regulator [Clostridia bacterium]|nr:AraC family transcriptional regulator [Clostridia bacterium]
MSGRRRAMDYSFTNKYGTQLCRTPTHIYLLPTPPLRPFIAHYTLCPESGGFPSDAPGSLTLIPDASGCFVLTLGDDLPDMRMYGPSTEAVTLPRCTEPSPPRFFVEFKPGGLFAFTGIPQHELRDGVWPLQEACPVLFHLFAQLARSAFDLDEFAAAVDLALCHCTQSDASIIPMLSFLTKSRSSRPVQALAEETTYSPRHLSRLFHAGAGMGCKSFLRILRVNAAVQRIGGGAPSLTALAQDLGYYDQAHFIHDFQSVCRVSPGAYRAALSDFYNEPFKL